VRSRSIDIISGILYGVFTAIFNLSVFIYLKILTKHRLTLIKEGELVQWKFGYLLSARILSGLSAAWLLEKMPFIIIDPVMTVIITLVPC